MDISDVVRVKEVLSDNDADDDKRKNDKLQAAAEVEEQIGPIYCLVNNAGVIHRTPCLVKNGSIEVSSHSLLVLVVSLHCEWIGLDEDCECECCGDPECDIHHLPLDGCHQERSCCQHVLHYGK